MVMFVKTWHLFITTCIGRDQNKRHQIGTSDWIDAISTKYQPLIILFCDRTNDATAVNVEWPMDCFSHVPKLPAALCFNQVLHNSVVITAVIEIVYYVEGLSTAGIR